MMQKKFSRYIVIGVIFNIIAGTLLHFLYEWSGKNPIVGLFAPVNESIIEHLKMLYFPMFLWVIIGYYKYARRNHSYFPSAFAGLICGLLTIPAIFYSYTAFTNTEILIVDIIIFILSIIIAYSIFGFIFLNYHWQSMSVRCGVLLWEIVFVLFTVYYLFL